MKYPISLITIVFLSFLLLPPESFSERGRPIMDGKTFRTDSGELIRGPLWASDILGRAPEREWVRDIKSYGWNALHLYGEAFSQGGAPGHRAAIIDTLVDWTREENIYLILTIGNAAQNGNYNYQYAVDFWNIYAPRYKDETHLIFEIQNEPQKWEAPYLAPLLDMERDVYQIIRGYAPDTPILLMSYAKLNNSANVMLDIDALAPTVDWSNAAVAFHGYAGLGTTRTALQGLLHAGIPCFQTEFAVSFQYLQTDQVRLYEEMGVSWLAFVRLDRLSDARISHLANRENIAWKPDFGAWPLHPHIRINLGGDSATPFGPDRFSSGVATNTPHATDLSHPLAAPEVIYQTGRVGNLDLNIKELRPFEPVELRLHVSETGAMTAGENVMSIRVNDDVVVGTFDPFEAAGGLNKATVLSVPARTDAQGNIRLQLTGISGSPLLNGLEVAPVLPRPWKTSVVGNMDHDLRGGVSHGDGQWMISGAGVDIWATNDGFRYVHQAANGDVLLETWVTHLQNANAWSKAGIMIRETTAANSRHAFLGVSSRNGLVFQTRENTGGTTRTVKKTVGLGYPYGLRFVKTGNQITGYISTDGLTWLEHGTMTLALPNDFTVGMAHTSHATGIMGAATFARTQVSHPQVTHDGFFRREGEHRDMQTGGGGIGACVEGGLAMNDLAAASALTFSGMDFGDAPALRLCLRVAANEPGGSIAVHLGTTNSPPLAVASVPFNGDVQSWETVCADVPALLGTNDLVLVCQGVQTWRGGLNWLCFERSGPQRQLTEQPLPIAFGFNAPSFVEMTVQGTQQTPTNQMLQVSLDDQLLGTWTPQAGEERSFGAFASPGDHSLALTGGASVTNVDVVAEVARPQFFVGRTDRWRYDASGIAPSADWRSASFDDANWSVGFGQFGYGDGGDEVTELPNNGQTTIYFRRSFDVLHPAVFSNLVVRLVADDGAVVYLNGREIVRHNMPGGTITSTTRASSNLNNAIENNPHLFSLPPALLVKGMNQLAVEVHQAQNTGNDMSFDLSLLGETGFTQAPVLEIEGTTVSWSAEVAGFSLESRPSVISSTPWKTMESTLLWSGAKIQMDLPSTNAVYRLRLE